MRAPFEKCSIEFSVNNEKNGYAVEWVKDIMQHTLVDEVVCIQDVTLADDGTARDMMAAILQFCNSNPSSIIMLMCGQEIHAKFDLDGKVIQGGDEDKLQRQLNLAKQKVAYSVIGFNDVSHWIDYNGTCVFLYNNDCGYDFLERLNAFRAGSYLSTLTELGSTADVIVNELRDSKRACAVLHSILDQADKQTDASGTQPMSSFS